MNKVGGPIVSDLYSEIIQIVKNNGGEMSHQEILDEVRQKEAGVTNSEFSGTLRWLRKYGNLVCVRDDVYVFGDEVDRRKNPQHSFNQRESARRRRETSVRFMFESKGQGKNADDEAVVVANPTGERREIAPFFRNALGHEVKLSRSENVVEDVIQIMLVTRGGVQINVPIPEGKVKICLGPNVPEWSTRQATNYNISKIAFLTKTGEFLEVPTNPNDPITIDEE